jgi:hypothetical protein
VNDHPVVDQTLPGDTSPFKAMDQVLWYARLEKFLLLSNPPIQSRFSTFG